MTVASVRFRSEAVGKWSAYTLFLPDVGNAPFPVIIQLHGLGEDHRSWIDRSNIVRHAEQYPMAIVFPDGGTSGYLDWKEAGRLHRQAWETLIVEDIGNHVRRHFNVTNGPWGIGGMSMGGYGAMHIGLKFPERFASIWAHSSAFHVNQRLAPDLIDQVAIDDANISSRVRQLAASGASLPAISFDCGVDDEQLDGNRQLHALMTELGVEHHYVEYPGAHTWDYWDEHVVEALAQHARHLVRSG